MKEINDIEDFEEAQDNGQDIFALSTGNRNNAESVIGHLIGAAKRNMPVFIAHDADRADDNPFSYIASYSIGVVVGYDEQNQPYVYNYHWTAEEAGVEPDRWETLKKNNQCLVIGWGSGDYGESKEKHDLIYESV